MIWFKHLAQEREKCMLVELVCATRKKQISLSITLERSCTISETLKISKILEYFPDIDLENTTVGVWGKLKTLETMVEEGDRIEIYRPLTIDPMEARRLRVKKKRK
jgi:uncharacterized protein